MRPELIRPLPHADGYLTRHSSNAAGVGITEDGMLSIRHAAFAVSATALALIAWVATSPVAAFAEGDWG